MECEPEKTIHPQTGILCGFRAEALLAAKVAGARVAMSAARVELARSRGQALLDAGASRLLSFGLAGGIDPAFRTGDVVIGTSVATLTESWACDPVWSKALFDKIPSSRQAVVFGSDRVLADPADKAALFQTTKSQIADMESHVVAALAAQARVPFAVLRVVVDPHDYALPSLALDALRESGDTDLAKILWGLVRQPWQVGALVALGRKSALAMKQLERATRALS